MGHKKDVRQFTKLAVRRKGLSFVHVEKCAEPSGFQRVDERLLVYYRSSRGVHKKRPLSEKRKLVFPYQPACLFSQRGVDGHDVALRQYPVKSLSFTHADGWSCKGDDGWAGRNDDPYYYYNAIVLPGTSTTELFGGDITMDFDSKLPKDYKVEIDVIADTVQAVSIDTSKWKEAGGTFSDTEVKQAWSMKPTNLPSVEATGSNLAITWTKTTT